MANQKHDSDISKIPLLTRLEASDTRFVKASAQASQKNQYKLRFIANHVLRRVLSQISNQDDALRCMGDARVILAKAIVAKLSHLTGKQFMRKYTHHWVERQIAGQAS